MAHDTKWRVGDKAVATFIGRIPDWPAVHITVVIIAMFEHPDGRIRVRPVGATTDLYSGCVEESILSPTLTQELIHAQRDRLSAG